jgi:hypothetical protein
MICGFSGVCVAGRSTERPVLSEAEIERNVQGIKRILEQLISSGNGAGPAPRILNNLVSCTVLGILRLSCLLLGSCKKLKRRYFKRHALVPHPPNLEYFPLCGPSVTLEVYAACFKESSCCGHWGAS